MIYNYATFGYPNIPYQKKDTYSNKNTWNMYPRNIYPYKKPTRSPINTIEDFHTSSKENNEISISENTRNSSQASNDVLFDFFGLKLYFDDVLLICLIFFLYNEGVKDEYLFIVLILLLLS